jgi:uncharacterized protein
MSAEIFCSVLRLAEEAASLNASGTISLVMHGGEPTLLSVALFRQFIAQAKRVLGTRLRTLSLQTNGTLLTEEWIEMLVGEGIEVSVSLDGPKEVHDQWRKDHRGRGSWADVVSGIKRLQAAGIAPNTLTVVNPGISGLSVYDHIIRLGIRHLNFLLPDVSHDEFRFRYGHLGPTPIADYLIPIFDAWYANDDPALQVAICWELIERLVGGPGITDMFGNPKLKYVVVETDGSIESLDALKVGGDGLADTGLNSLKHGLSDLMKSQRLASLAVTQGFPLASECAECNRAKVCGGGYLPQRYSRRRGFDNPSVWCRDLKRIFDHVEGRIHASEVTV